MSLGEGLYYGHVRCADCEDDPQTASHARVDMEDAETFEDAVEAWEDHLETYHPDLIEYGYTWYGRQGETFDTMHEAVGELAIVLRENEWLSPRVAAGRILAVKKYPHGQNDR